MTFPFDGQQGLIIVDAEVEGPTGAANLRLALDTGATRTLISRELLAAIACERDEAGQESEAATVSGVETVPHFVVRRLAALGSERKNLTVIGHTLPPQVGVDGLLGLDFLRGKNLTVNFAIGQVVLD
jgi:predicted aspartyl protease